MKLVRLTRPNCIRPETAGDPGEVRVLSDEMAADMVLNELAVIISDSPDGNPVPVPVEAPEPLPEFAAREALPSYDDPEITIDWPADKRPYGNHPKALWVRYAVLNHGADPELAARMPKSDLMSRYGERL